MSQEGFNPPWQCAACGLPNNSWEFHVDHGHAIYGSCGCVVPAETLLTAPSELIPVGMAPMLNVWKSREQS